MYRDFAQFKASPGFHLAAYNLGHAAELALLGTLREFFAASELALSAEGATFDNESPARLVELKTRTVRRLAYHDTAIGANKIRYARCSTKAVVFVFRFTNRLFYWKYDSTVMLRAGLLFGVPHFFIPTASLIRIGD